MRRNKNRQQQAPEDPAAARLAELTTQFRAQGISEPNAQLAARHQLEAEQREERERPERERQERERHELIEWYDRGEMRACPGVGCHSVLHAPENVIPEHWDRGGWIDVICPGSGAIVTEAAPIPAVLDEYRT